jgi:uncharacterized damage-inducible protein DinB
MPHNLPQLIDAFEAGADIPSRWAHALTREELLAHPVPGTWSVQQVIVHVLDSDLAASHRMRRVASEDLPLLIAYDETRFAGMLRYDLADTRQVCELFATHRRFTAAWLRTVPPEAFSREGVHNQRGRVSLEQLVQFYIDHLAHHDTFVLAKRAKLGRGE